MAATDDLRLLLSEKKVDPNGDGSDTLLTDTELELILTLAGDNLNRAAAIGWAVKGGHYSDMIDMNESGSQRRLNQLFTNCERMWKMYDSLAVKQETVVSANAGRVVGIGFDPYTCSNEPLVSIFSRYGLDYGTVRMFPLKRFFPAVLQ